MKKTLLILGLGVILTSCGDSGLSFDNNCDCGIITKKIDNGLTYSMDVENNCSGNIKRFAVTKKDFYNHREGRGICFSNQW